MAAMYARPAELGAGGVAVGWSVISAARIDPVCVLPSSSVISSCFTNFPRMASEQIW